MTLSGKVLVLTGAAGGLGQSVAATLGGYGERLALPAEAAGVMAFFASDAARAVAGASIPVAGRV